MGDHSEKFILALILLNITSPCFADACYSGKTEMIILADGISVMNITRVKEVEKRQKGGLTITDDKLFWFKGDQNSFATQRPPLEKVTSEIKKILKKTLIPTIEK